MKKEIEKFKVYYAGGRIAIYGKQDTEVRDKINEIIDELNKLNKCEKKEK